MTAPLPSLDVLVVDDDVARHGRYREIIGDLAGEVVTLSSDAPVEALVAARSFAVAVVHCDACGATAGDARAVSARLEAAGVPLVGIAATVADLRERLGGAGGAVDVVPEPLDPALLRVKLDGHLALQRSRFDLARAEERMAEMARALEAMGATLAACARETEVLRAAVGEHVHRTKNLLAIVQSIALRTVNDGRAIAEARDALLGRLRALARAYHLAVAPSGAPGVEMADLVEAQLGDVAHRVAVLGPPVRIVGSLVQTFALAVHELASNAVRHGALAATAGSASLSWAYFEQGDDRYLDIAWREQGGATVAPPPKYGFGLSLVSSLAPQGATPSVRFEPDGFSCTLRLPRAALAAA